MPHTIDLALSGVEADGTRTYAPPIEALGMQIGRGMYWLLMNHPRETLHAAALGAVAGTCLYLARDTTKTSRRRRN